MRLALDDTPVETRELRLAAGLDPAKTYAEQKIVTPADAHSACRDIEALAQETFHVLTLNARNALINRHMVSLGVVDSALVHPREVFLTAIRDQASAIIIVHNHPSGDPCPSSEDIKITRQLVDAGKIIGIKVLDHVIVGKEIPPIGNQPGRSGFLSLREGGLVMFE